MQDLHIRWMIRRDMPRVLEIENACYSHPWTKEDFVEELRKRNCIGMVADLLPPGSPSSDRVIGYMIYNFHKTFFLLKNIAVDPLCMRQGVGGRMVEKLVAKLTPQRRTRVSLEIRESNLAAQLFFKAQGFRAVNVLHGFYEGTDEDAYVFTRHVADAKPAPVVGGYPLLDT